MVASFFVHPLWKKFQNRPIFVICLSDPEHRLRDANAIIRLREFLPPPESGIVTYVTVTVHEERPSVWPKIPAGAGIVILGRPAFFGPMAEEFLRVCRPSLGFQFESDDRTMVSKYRTIAMRDVKPKPFRCPSFMEQCKGRALPVSLYDYAIIYSGWDLGASGSAPRPVMLVAGTSTLGTWGGVTYMTEPPFGDDIRWQEDIQGVVRTDAKNTPEAFEDVAVSRVEVLSPCRIWMEGADLPPSKKEWAKQARSMAQETGGNPKLDLRVLINGREIMPKLKTYIPPLVLLALANRGPEGRFRGEVSCQATTTQVSKAVYSFLTSGQENSEIDMGVLTSHVSATLKALVKQVRKAGGIAYNWREGGHGKEGTTVFCLSRRSLPSFLPRIP